MAIPHKRKTIEGRRSRRRKQPSNYAEKRARWRTLEKKRQGVNDGT